MSSVPHLSMAHPTVRTGRALLAAGLVASALSGCAIWPKALTFGGGQEEVAAAPAEPDLPTEVRGGFDEDVVSTIGAEVGRP